MTFKPDEIDFMRATALGRLATIQPNGTPQVSPVGFSYNEELGTIDIAGYRMSSSQKYRNIARNDKVAFVVDDIASRDPTTWTPRSSGSRRDTSSASASTTRTPSRTS